jgi:hypothetical protein
VAEVGGGDVVGETGRGERTSQHPGDVGLARGGSTAWGLTPSPGMDQGGRKPGR